MFFLIQTGATTSAKWVEDCRHKPSFFREKKLVFACLSIKHPPFSRFGQTKDPKSIKNSRSSIDFIWFPHELAKCLQRDCLSDRQSRAEAKIQDSNGPKNWDGNFYQNWPWANLTLQMAPLGSARTLSSTSQKNFRCRFSSSLTSGWTHGPHGEPQHLGENSLVWPKMAKRVKT